MTKLAVIKITLTTEKDIKDWEVDAASEALDEIGWTDIVNQKLEEAGFTQGEIKIEVSDL